MITIEDIKIYMLNTSVLAVSFTDLEMLLKVMLLTATIVYTVQKILKRKEVVHLYYDD